MEGFDSPYLLNGMGGLMLGTVTSNSDSQKKGSLKVRLCGGEDVNNILEDVKVLAFCAGEDYGAYLLPEIGEQVVVGFLNGCFDRPVVLGSLYTPSDSMLINSFHNSNAIKRLRTKGGTVVEFNDASNEETIKISTLEHLAIVMQESSQAIKISADDTIITLDGKGGKLSMEASKQLSLKCGKAEITMKEAGDIKVSGVNIEISGMKLKAESDGALTLKGKAAELSGASVEVKASGMMTIKGSLTKIN